ncbi:unnamed protein product, partial [Ectocarpus sp. 12 AP-2014]
SRYVSSRAGVLAMAFPAACSRHRLERELWIIWLTASCSRRSVRERLNTANGERRAVALSPPQREPPQREYRIHLLTSLILFSRRPRKGSETRTPASFIAGPALLVVSNPTWPLASYDIAGERGSQRAGAFYDTHLRPHRTIFFGLAKNKRVLWVLDCCSHHREEGYWYSEVV